MEYPESLVANAKNLAKLYLAGFCKGTEVDFSIGCGIDLGIKSAGTPTNDGDYGLCDYVECEKFGLSEPDQYAIIATTDGGHIHIFFGQASEDEEVPAIVWFDPLIFLCRVS